MPKPIKRQQWSNIDVFGLLNGISTWDPQYRTLQYIRSPSDTVLDLRNKILRYHDNPVGVTKQGLLNGLSNEFGYDVYNTKSTNTFQLTNEPFPSGTNGTKDVWVDYRAVGSSGAWTEIPSQIWSSGYLVAKEEKRGYILWQNEKYTNVPTIKNFTYSRILEVLEDLPDYQELRITYIVRGVDEDNNLVLKRFTDLNNPNDPDSNYFVYRKPVEISPLSGVVVYNLHDIPSGLFSRYYDSNSRPTEQLYTIKNFLNSRLNHKWGTITDASVIWDVHQEYGSGTIPHYYDVDAPKNIRACLAKSKEDGTYFSGFIGGVEPTAASLYFNDIVESGEAFYWYFTLYPGKFYLDGSPFYLFENPGKQYITFSNGVATLPTGVQRGAHIVIAKSGYYEDACVSPDPYLSGFVYEDHTYPTGEGEDYTWSDVYRRRGYLPPDVGYVVNLEIGEYYIDFSGGLIYSNTLDDDAVIVWENSIIPSGRLITYDINPLNDKQLNLQKFFIYIANKEM